MEIIFWILTTFTVLWYLGALGFVYHIFSFRYPKDITLQMFVVYILIAAPISLYAVGKLAEFYGRVY